MSKQETTEGKLDFNIGSIFGDFQPETKFDNEGDPDVVKDLPDEIVDEIKEESEETTKETKETKESKAKKAKEELENESEEDVEVEEVEEDTDSTDSTEEHEEVEYSYKALASYLAEQGVIDFEDSEDLEDSPELLEEAVFNTAKNMVEEYKNSIPEEGKRFLDYLEKGGDPAKYLSSLERPLDLGNIDLENEDNQKKVLREFLKSQDYTTEEIEEELKDYEDALILGKKAKIAAKKLESIYEKNKEELVKQQEEYNKQRQKDIEKQIKTIRDTINSSTTLGGLPVSVADKKAFEQYLLARDKSGLTQYEKDIQENPLQTQLELAYLKYKKFDFSKVSAKVKTEEARRIKNLIKTKDVTPKGKSKEISNNKSDMSAFRGFLK